MEERMSNAAASREVTVSCPSCDTLNRVVLARWEDGPRCATCGQPFQLDQPQTVSGEAFERVVAGTDVPVLIDFYADWCGPCRRMAPVLDRFARDRAGEVLVGKLDTDRDPEIAMRLGIRGIPTLIVFSGGREVARQVGVVPRSGLDALLGSVAQPAT
jgi:thioredoxin 2